MRKISSHTGRGFLALSEEEIFRPRLGVLVRTEDRVLMMGGIIAGNIYVVQRLLSLATHALRSISLLLLAEGGLGGSVLRALTEHRPRFENVVILVCAVSEHREPLRPPSASHFCEYHR